MQESLGVCLFGAFSKMGKNIKVTAFFFKWEKPGHILNRKTRLHFYIISLYENTQHLAYENYCKVIEE